MQARPRRDRLPVEAMCALLGVARSTYYHWQHRVGAETATAARRRRLADLITDAFDRSRRTYGCRRITAQLNRDGHACSVGLVASVMRELGLVAVQPRAYKRTTIPGEAEQIAATPDLIGREFTATEPGRRLVGDITYLKTGEGWLYLATVIDLCTRMVVGWRIADHMRTGLVVDALEMARDHGHLAADAVFHTDRGTQYTSSEFATWCRNNDVQRSLGRTGVCWDNAVAESFFAALKNECYHLTAHPTKARARFAVADYIEVFYNRQRLHTALGYRTPAEALEDHRRLTAAA
jgi:putative transposase